MIEDVVEWMNTVSGETWVWYIKYLSGNDTLLNGSHQAGPYISKPVAFALFPGIENMNAENPRAEFSAAIDSHGAEATPRAIWYNNRLRGGTRNECRLTNWGGGSSPIMDPEETGSLCVFAFHKAPEENADFCRVWLCSSVEEEDAVLERVGPVEPGTGVLYRASAHSLATFQPIPADSSCRLTHEDIPEEWLVNFPEAAIIVGLAVSRLPTAMAQAPDQRLLRRRECEFELFQSLEEAIVLPRILEGFATVGIFVDFANSLLNRRKSRSGASLELHAKKVFEEEALPHAYDQTSEGRKRPDFLFPSADAYRNAAFAAERLQMLAVKTTCKDRWRQILNEADRIPNKHLLTLQHGISLNQWGEMRAAGVRLVVPSRLHMRYHETIRPDLLSLSQFIDITRAKCS